MHSIDSFLKFVDKLMLWGPRLLAPPALFRIFWSNWDLLIGWLVQGLWRFRKGSWLGSKEWSGKCDCGRCRSGLGVRRGGW
jgi:hypothetical protein